MRTSLLFVFCLLSGLAHAETTDWRLIKYDICSNGYEVYHINGIFTDPTGAQANLRELSLRYGNTHDGHLIRYNLAYNQTQNMLDLRDSFLQVAFAFPGVSYSDWLYAVWTGVVGGTVTGSVVKAIANLIAYDIDRPSPYQDADLVSIQAAFNKTHKPGARSLIVGHSQGTLYANLLYDRLIKQTTPAPVPAASLGMVFVAAATSAVKGGGSYVTGTNDSVINTVRTIGDKNTLKATLTNPYIPDTYGHNFIRVYLNTMNANTVNTIKGQMFAGMQKLKSGPPYSQRRPQIYPHVTVQWLNCGPASGNPYNCWYTPGGNVTPIIKTVPFYTYYKIDVATSPIFSQELVAVDGSLADAVAMARSLAMTCQSVATAEYNKMRLAGSQTTSTHIKGCFPYYGAPGPFEGIHADTMAVRTYHYPEISWNNGVLGYVDGICRII